MLFDGKKFAKEKEEVLKGRVKGLARKPVLVSVLVGENRASELYMKMKKNAAERMGIEFRIERISEEVDKSELMERLRNFSTQEVDGIMVQLPFPADLDKDTAEILTAIEKEKDADGLRWQDSGVMPATVRAVMSILDSLKEEYGIADLWEKKFALVGYTGNVGAPLMNFLQKKGVKVEGINSKTENADEILQRSGAVISCVGKPGIVREEQIAKGIVVVDVGIDMVDGKPIGDMGNDVYKKAAVAVPVPGGVGPVTVVSLFENLLDLI